jgi:hypothetical protein
MFTGRGHFHVDAVLVDQHCSGTTEAMDGTAGDTLLWIRVSLRVQRAAGHPAALGRQLGALANERWLGTTTRELDAPGPLQRCRAWKSWAV